MQTAKDSFEEAPEDRELLRASFQRLGPDFHPVTERQGREHSGGADQSGAMSQANPDRADPSQDGGRGSEYESPALPGGPAVNFQKDAPALDIRMLAHDLRAPLASAKLSLQVMRDSRLTPEKKDKALDLAQRSLQALDELIGALVSPVSDRRPASTREVRAHGPRDLILSAIDQVALLASEKNLRLSAGSIIAPPSLVCDGVGITRVLVNLFSNAIKVSPMGGGIVIEARQRNNDGHPAVVFSVTDEGPGVTRELAERIFDVGVSIAHNGKPSTGLGLAICRKIVEAHRGRIWVETDRTHGATFSFAIPLDTGRAEMRGPAASPHEP